MCHLCESGHFKTPKICAKRPNLESRLGKKLTPTYEHHRRVIVNIWISYNFIITTDPATRLLADNLIQLPKVSIWLRKVGYVVITRFFGLLFYSDLTQTNEIWLRHDSIWVKKMAGKASDLNILIYFWMTFCCFLCKSAPSSEIHSCLNRRCIRGHCDDENFQKSQFYTNQCRFSTTLDHQSMGKYPQGTYLYRFAEISSSLIQGIFLTVPRNFQ